jgi:NAD(P)-dependent dehydrogenase (short-subunit alcohol dehydrogenase family)
MAPEGPRVAIVTGGTRGLGAAVTTRLAAQGVAVAAAYRSDLTAATELESSIDAPAGLSLHQVDVSDPEQCRRLVADVLSAHGRLDHLINNAGSLTERRLADITSDDFEVNLRTNLTSAFVLAQRGSGGS